MSQDKKKPEPVTVSVTRRIMARDPEVHVFFLNVENETGAWPEGFGSEGETAACLRGMEIMARMLDRPDVVIPAVPGRNEAKE